MPWAKRGPDRISCRPARLARWWNPAAAGTGENRNAAPGAAAR